MVFRTYEEVLQLDSANRQLVAGKLIRAPKKKVNLSSNGPQKPVTAYQHFCREERAKMAELNFGQQSKELGARWKSLTGEDRKKFEELASQDKLRYVAEVAESRRKQFSNTPVASSSGATVSGTVFGRNLFGEDENDSE